MNPALLVKTHPARKILEAIRGRMVWVKVEATQEHDLDAGHPAIQWPTPDFRAVIATDSSGCADVSENANA